MVSELMQSVPKKTITGRPDIGFTLKMPLKGGGGAIDYPKQPEKLQDYEVSPYWSQRIYDSGRDTFDLNYFYRSNFPITSTATHGGMWSAAASGWIFNKYLKQRLLTGAQNAIIKNPHAAAFVGYAIVAGVASHDAAALATQTSQQRQFWLGGWKLDMGMSIGSAIT
jgi:ribosome modulation factor